MEVGGLPEGDVIRIQRIGANVHWFFLYAFPRQDVRERFPVQGRFESEEGEWSHRGRAVSDKEGGDRAVVVFSSPVCSH